MVKGEKKLLRTDSTPSYLRHRYSSFGVLRDRAASPFFLRLVRSFLSPPCPLLSFSALSDLPISISLANNILHITQSNRKDMSSRSADAESRENTPDQDGSPEERRTSKKRKVLSCYACRSRKMKCDRVYPVCGRCQKTGRADQCTYDPRLLGDHGDMTTVQADGHNASNTRHNVGTGDHGSGSSSFDALHLKAQRQERRVAELERLLAVKDDNNPPSRFEDFHPREPEHQEEMMFRGKGFKTQFHGSTSVMSTIAQVCLPPQN
jgi:hypothetical protein